MVNIFHHGAKENDIFCFKLYVVDFFDIDNLHKKFASNISKIGFLRSTGSGFADQKK